MPSTLNVCDLCLKRLKGGVAGRGLALPPHPRHHTGMDTSTTPSISPALEPETMMALTLRYVEDHEVVADRYLRALLRHLMIDLYPRDAFRLVRDIVTESTNDIVDFEGEEAASRVDVALRRLIDHAEADEADEAFMAELTERAEWGL